MSETVAVPAKTVVSINFFRQAIVLVYPVIAVIGKLASYTIGDSYFAHKRNIFNVLFVKNGWLWTSLVFWGGYLLHVNHSTNYTKTGVWKNKPNRIEQVTARYVAATVWWILFTQWFFGAPIMDRIFVLTGGQCQVPNSFTASGDPEVIASAATSHRCRSSGGAWVGGHDPSGHFFLLIHGSLVLWQEIIPTLHRVCFDGSYTEGTPFYIKPALCLLALWGWMFLMTSIYFHSFLEKLSGMLFGFTEIFVVYYLGSFYPWGQFFGIPALNAEALEDTTPAGPVPGPAISLSSTTNGTPAGTPATTNASATD